MGRILAARKLGTTLAALAVGLGTVVSPTPPTPAAAASAAASASASASASVNNSSMSVSHLRTDYTRHPLGIDNPRPRLSWQLESERIGARQSAYQVLVATDPTLLREDRADVWDSGRVESSASVGVRYDGPDLQSATRYHWVVRVWDGSGKVTRWSQPAWWETGLLEPGDWSGAQWIAPESGEDVSAWSDYEVELDFTIASGAAGVIFRALSPSDYYMWQVNAILGDEVLLRPHVQQGGSWRVLDEIPLSDVIAMSEAFEPHHLRIRAEGPTITTFVDGVQVDSRTDHTFTSGPIGFRSGDGKEDCRYDNVVVRGLDGAELFTTDFSTVPDPAFPHARIEDGTLRTAGGDVQILSGQQPEAPLLRRDFALDKEIASARAYAYGLGWYELRLNGRKVGDRVLSPAASPYASRNLYQTYDVTRLLRDGANAIGLWLADGYGPTYSQWGWRWFGPRQAIVKLAVTYADGTTETVVTDPSWRWEDGPITRAHIYHGETYDARLEQPGWDQAGFDDGDWGEVRTVPAPSDRLVAETAPPIRVVDTLRPVRRYEPEPGVYVFDLGQNISGWTRVEVTGERGTEVRLRHAEAMNPDGSLDTFTNRAAEATDRFVLAGTGRPETYEPRFTYHGFRYVEVSGLPYRPRLDTVEGRVVHADVDSTASFVSSDPLLNQIYRNGAWTMLNNSMSFPTDTAVRDERTPPGMDVQAYQDASTRLFGMNRFYAKYLQDMTPLPRGGSPEMSGMPVTLAWTLYEQYGDQATLERHYDQLADYVDSLAAQTADGIWPESNGFGDWCPPVPPEESNDGMGSPGAGGYGHCMNEVSLVNTALYYRQASTMADAAEVLGRADDAAAYGRLAEDVKAAFNEHFLDPATGAYGDGRQTTSILPIAFGMVPEQYEDVVADHFVRTVLQTNDGHLDTGIFGTRYLVDALVEVGRPDIALTVLRQRSYPGFGFQIGLGATTMWEEWTYRSSMHTYDHAMFAGLDASFLTHFAGIRQTAPGYASVEIRPAAPAGLESVSASLDTVRGTVSVRWRHVDGGLDLEASVPPNMTADVWVPVSAGDSVRETESAGRADLVEHRDGHAVFEVGSGHYQFQVS